MTKNKNRSKKQKSTDKKVEQIKLEKEREKLLDDERTPLARKIARNIDQLMIVASIDQPEFNCGLVDRFIILASLEEVEPVLCITKADLADDRNDLNKWKNLYKSLKIDTISTSSISGEGIEDLKRLLYNKRTALAGHSGVGKSTLLNLINPNLKIETDTINLLTGKGRHVTKKVKLYRLDEYTGVFDLPGVKLIDFPDLTIIDVASMFPDFNSYKDSCKFNDCTHIPEPDCAVKEAIEKGLISRDRYESYLRISEELVQK